MSLIGDLNLINWIEDGEPAEATVFNRPLRDFIAALQDQTISLLSKISGYPIQLGNIGDISEGDWVYFNQSTLRYEKAIADGTEKQEVVGIYTIISGVHTIVFSGHYMDTHKSDYIPGASYYLSSTVAGTAHTIGDLKVAQALGSNEIYIRIGTSIPQEVVIPTTVLPTPVVSANKTFMDAGQNATFTISNIPADATSVTWEVIGGSIVSGNMSGTLNDNIIVTSDQVGTIIVRAMFIGDNDRIINSQNSLHVQVTVNAVVVQPDVLPQAGVDLDKATAIPGESITATIQTVPANAVSIAWEVTNGVLVNGYLTGSLNSSIVVKSDTDATVSIRAKFIGNGTTVIDGDYSDPASCVVAAEVVDPGTFDRSLLGNENACGVLYTEPQGSTLNFNCKTVENPLSPAKKMYFTLEGNTTGIQAKIDFAEDYLGESFEVEFEGSTWSGTFAEVAYADIIELTLIGSDPVEVTTFDTSLNGNESASGVFFTEPQGSVFSYNSVTVENPLSPAKKMYFQISGTPVVAKLDFAEDYIGNPFDVSFQGTLYSGTFQEVTYENIVTLS